MNNFLEKHPKLQFFYRKRVLALKRNYYTLPLILITICSFYFLCILYILNKSVGRCDYKPTAVFLFIATLASILSIVAFINYAKKVYGQERPFKMLIVYYVLIIICLAFVITIFVYNEKQIKSEIVKQSIIDKETDRSWYTYQTYINYGKCTRGLLIVFFVLEAISNGLLIAGPKLEKELQKVHFSNINKNGQTQGQQTK